MTSSLFAHASQPAGELAAIVARNTKPMLPRGTCRTAANDGCYGTTRAFSVTHRQPDGRCRSINVIASSYVAAEIAALDQMSFPGH